MRVYFHRTLQLNRSFALRSYPSSVGYAATFSPGGEGFCYLQKVFSLHTRFGFIDTLSLSPYLDVGAEDAVAGVAYAWDDIGVVV